ncbi:hypothetical protein EX30DRAFT_315529 [Ascodesmis nigricans]|uniref:Class E vacuolar protein-sorting machinery protein HSE1 n=1 Tax=Ascodesmis nigricans TaxID=341454 RepID=A0A4S2N3S9_9PEZI|nr:hypothetical protein EX30DRAFT_315529 [Ascodesmis nigricans]
MFRSQSNPFDDVVAKATDENLTSVNWEYMLDAWEKVNAEPETGAKDAVAALIKRLAHRNANVQLYTLELANAFTQNCGHRMHQEMASRAFTDALLRLAGDRTTHQTVKASVVEKMEEWVKIFEKDPGLGIMDQAFQRLKSQNPTLQAPSKPHKREITELDRQKEEEELQMALAISLKDRGSQQPGKATTGGSAAAPAAASQSPTGGKTSPPAPQPPHTTAATVSRVRALYDFVPSEAGELAFRKGDIIAVLESVYKDWWKGSLRGQTGIFPLNYVEKLADPTVEELQRDAQVEAEVFGQIKNVEKLLAMLSTSDGNMSVQDNDEITTLYNSTVAIRPKLIELIAKYSQKKDEFVALNEKFIKARRDYETLLESSMSQSAHYPRPPISAGQYAYPPPSQTPYPMSTPAAPSHTGYPPPGQHHPSSRPNRTPSNSYYPTAPVDHQPPHSPVPGPVNTQYYAVGGPPPPQELATESYNTPTTENHSSKPQSSPYTAYPGGSSSSAAPPASGYQPYQRPSSSVYPPATSPSPGPGASTQQNNIGGHGPAHRVNSYRAPSPQGMGNTFYPPLGQPQGGVEDEPGSYYRGS